MSFLKQATLNTAASVGGRIISAAFALISFRLIAETLGPAGFGEYAIVIAYLGILQVFADLGLYTLMTREISQKPERERELVSEFFTLRLVAAALFLAIGAALVFAFPYSHNVQLGVVFASSGFLALSLSQMAMGVFQKYMQMYRVAIIEMVGRAVQLGLVAYAALVVNAGFFAFIAAMVASSFVIVALNVVFARRLVPFSLRVSVSSWKGTLKTTLPIAASLVFTMLYFRADTILLSLLATEEDVGLYGIAYRVLEQIIFLPAVMVGVAFPRLAHYAREHAERFLSSLATLFGVMAVAAFPLVAGGILLSPSIVYYLGGPEFTDAARTMQMLFVAVGIIFFGTLMGNSVIALNIQKKAMWAYAAGFVFNFIANLIVIPRFTYEGAAATTVLTELVVTGYLIWVVYRAAPFRPDGSLIGRALLATAVMAAGVWLVIASQLQPLAPFAFVAAVALGVVLFSTAAFALRIHTGILTRWRRQVAE
ncbi:MAG: flippase [Candidatus Spechtbacterales bacterium]